jgi:putative ATP-binding cassette transporter
MRPNSKPAQAATQWPPEVRHGTILTDAGYLFLLVGRYIRVDPILGPLLLLLGLGGSMLIAVAAIAVTVQMGRTVDALAKGNGAQAWAGIMAMVLSLAGLMLVQAAMYGARYVFRIRWRTVFTRRLLGRWLETNRFYHLQRRHRLDNPEQRIQEDLFLVAEQMSDLMPTLLSSATTFALSIGLLWGLSRTTSIAPFGLPITIPADLLTCSLVFGALWVIGAHYVGRAITRVEVVRQRLEADFRHGLAMTRENAEAVAFERGGAREESRALGRYDLIRGNWREFTIAQIRLLLFNIFTGNIVPRLLPIALSVPRLLSGQMTIGDLTIAQATFGNVLSAMTFVAAYYAQLAAFRASISRVRFFQEVLDQPIESNIHVVRRPGNVLIENVAIDLPEGKRLLDVERVEVSKGDRILIRGRSGAGKSTMLRALAGLWPDGSGTIGMPPDSDVIFLPQRSYMPDGTLAELLTFPELPVEGDHARYAAALETLSLGAYIERLSEVAQWRHILSPGEQQRMAVIRALLRGPDFIFLDEATSALDVQLEADLYRALVEQLPDSAIISVAHRPTVAQFHKSAIEVADGRASACTVIDHSQDKKEKAIG